MANRPALTGGAAWGSIGIMMIGLAMFDAGSAEAGILDAKTVKAQRSGLPDGTRLVTPPAAPGDPYQRGKALLASDDAVGAVAAFRAALVDDPQSVDALNGLGIAFDRLGRYDIARGYYDMALALAPESPLVLNNLGYSLYLQGQDAAAIPVLQRALAATTPGGPAPARRILALIADRLRSRAVTSDAVLARAEIATPVARIELAANGEQRLVFAAVAPAPELVARLGDAAALTTPARAWTAHDDAVVAASAGAPPPKVVAPAVVQVGAVAEPAARSFVQLSSQPALPLAPPRRQGEPVLRVVTIAAAAPAGRTPLHPAPRRPRADALALLRDDRSLAWLALAVPARTPQPPAPLPARDVPTVRAGFDSDDPELNAFAARMVSWRAAGWA